MNDTLQNHHSSTISIDTLAQKILLGCLLFSLSIFTVFGNLLILYAIRTEKCLRTVSNLFILSLAFADFAVGIFVMPLSAANIIAGRWPFSATVCQLWLSIDYVASTASIFNLVLLSFDRYRAVVYPLRYLQNRSRKQATRFIVIVWFISLLWAPAIIFWSYIIPEHSDIIKPTECDTSFRSNKIFKTSTALVNFYLPLLTMVVISCRIMVAVRSRSRMEFGRRISSATQKQMRQERSIYQSALQNQGKSAICTLIEDSVGVHRSDSVRNISDIPSDQIEDDNDSLGQLETTRSPSTNGTYFCFPSIKPMRVLFPSFSSIRETNGHKTDILSRKSSQKNQIKSTSSILNASESPVQQSTSCNYLPRTSSTSDLSEICTRSTSVNPSQEQVLKKKITVQIARSSSVQQQDSLRISNHRYLTMPLISSNKTNILTFLDYIMNPSLSSSLQKELKAARQLGMLVGVFTVTWLPYFILFLVVAWCQHCVSDTVYTASIWLGYLNSTFNPLIYPLCNIHFRRAFKKILYCKHAKTKSPHVNTSQHRQEIS